METKENQEILPAESAFITVEEATKSINATAKLIKSSATKFGITAGHLTKAIISTTPAQSEKAWRIGVSITVPRFKNLVFGALAAWGAPGATKRIEFVLKGESDAVTTHINGKQDRKAHKYTILNGTFQKRNLSTEMEKTVPFKDKTLRNLYGATFDSTDFEQILRVILSEMTDQEAFPNWR